MSDTIVPESRIFRIGRECYIVYLGKERDDIRPFLRIGNARNIPDEVHQAVTTTVVTDDHIGNPLLEILNAPKINGRYLGDTAVVGEIRKFFKSFDLSTDEVTDYRKVKDGEKRHMVWFFSSGNIHLRYDEQVIFDLHKREKADRHFVRLYEEAKAEFLRNPLRYIRQDFAGPGVILSEGNAFWYESGEMLSLAAHPGFVARLMNDGTDPDFITASIYDMDREDMDSREAAVYIGFIKRMRQRRKQLRVLTSKPELQRKLRLLFPARGDVPATLDVTDVSGRKKATFRDSIISRKNDHWRIHRAGLPEIALDGGVEGDGIEVDIPRGVLTVVVDGKRTTLKPPAGFPIDFVRTEPSLSQMTDRYAGFVFNQVKDHLSAEELQAVTVLDKYLRMLKDDIAAGKAAVSPLLKQNASAVRDAVKRLDADGGPSWFYFANASGLLSMMEDEAGTDHPLGKSAGQTAAAVDGLLGRIPDPDPILPFWADLHIGDAPRIFWRATKRGFVPADLNNTRDANDRITEITRLDEAPWQDDLERLLALIRSLGQGGQGPLTDEQIALLKQPEENKPAAGSGEEPRKAPAATAVRDRDTVTGDSGKARPAETPSRKKASEGKTGGGRAWLWILAILLLLLIGGAVAWDLSGRAPWGSVLTSVERSDRLEGERGDGEVRDADGSDGTGTDTADAADGDGAGDAAVGDGDASGDAAGGTGTEAAGDGTEIDGGAGGTEGSTGGGDGDGKVSGDEPAGPVDADVAPRTPEEVKAYLDVDGRVPITEADIHLAANGIAVLNGFKDLDYRVFTGNDPDWIYPGNILELPGGGEYTVRKGDTIWFLAAREVRLAVEKELNAYDTALETLDSGNSGADGAAETLREISRNSPAEAMRVLAGNALVSRQL